MKNIKCLLAVVFVISLLSLVGCGETEEPKSKGININQIEVMASAKLLAESKVIEKENLPEDIAYIAEAGNMTGLKLDMISGLYTKSGASGASGDEFDKLHDYKFLFSNEEKTAQVSICTFGAPLRDYFFQASSNESDLLGIEAIVYKFKDRYIVRVERNGINYDIETSGMDENEMSFFVTEVVR